MKVLYSDSLKTSRHSSLKNGEKVRIAKVTTLFSKGHKPQFTDDFFKIIDLRSTVPRISYGLEELKVEKILRKFYLEELSRHCSSINSII